MTRQEANREILNILYTLVESHPDWRFHQLLMNVRLEEPEKDKFYEESEKTNQDLVFNATGM